MDMMTEVFNVGDKVECVRDSPDNNDSIAIGVQGVICVIVDSSPHIGVRMTMTSLMLTQQSLTSSLNLSQGRPSHDGFGFYKSALFAGLSGR